MAQNSRISKGNATPGVAELLRKFLQLRLLRFSVMANYCYWIRSSTFIMSERPFLGNFRTLQGHIKPLTFETMIQNDPVFSTIKSTIRVSFCFNQSYLTFCFKWSCWWTCQALPLLVLFLWYLLSLKETNTRLRLNFHITINNKS